MTTTARDRGRAGWRARLPWMLTSTVGFGVGSAVSGAMGDVVGEALGGPVLHALGHTVGTVLFGAIVAGAQWLVLRRQAAWASQWALAIMSGYTLGALLYGPVFVLTSGVIPPPLAIWLTVLVPWAGAGIVSWLALRQQVIGAGRWALAYILALDVGMAVAWFAGGGVAGARADILYPLVDSAIRYALHQLPNGVLGGVVFGIITGSVLVWLPKSSHPEK